jgi:uncharacterized repeat protein (TIGR03803 family)
MFIHRHAAQRFDLAKAALWLFAAIIVISVLSPISGHAQTETILYSFNYQTAESTGCPPGSYNDLPYTGVLYHDGHIFGTTPEGGAGEKGVTGSKDGMVFKLTPQKSGELPWSRKTVHSFIGEPETPDGLYPCGNLIQLKGVLYGTTIAGGSHNFGTVFKLTPPPLGGTTWTETILYEFTGGNDGGWPVGGLVMDADGNLYGVGDYGLSGDNGGVVFKLTCTESSCTDSTLMFNENGVFFNGNLLLDPANGSLFGTTSNGGPNNQSGYGNVFQLIPQGDGWTYDDLYDFTGGSDGAYPNGGLAGFPPSNLFGTTTGGGNGFAGTGFGVLFELRQLTPGSPYTLFIQHTFAGESSDGANSTAGLYQDANNNFWGTTPIGGSNNAGTIFELYPDRVKANVWHYQEVYSFVGELDYGFTPQSALTGDSSGNLYGTTNQGGTYSQGTVFEFAP